MSGASPQPVPRKAAQPALRSRLITLIAGGVAVAYALLVFVPMQQSIAGTHRQLRDQRAQIVQSLTLVQRIRELEEQFAATEQFNLAWQNKAPASQHVASVFADVIRHAKESGAEVMSLSPQAERPLETISRIPVSLTVEGSYHSLHALLACLEGMTGVVWVDEIQLQPKEKGASRLACTIKLVIFSKRSEISG